METIRVTIDSITNPYNSGAIFFIFKGKKYFINNQTSFHIKNYLRKLKGKKITIEGMFIKNQYTYSQNPYNLSNTFLVKKIK